MGARAFRSRHNDIVYVNASTEQMRARERNEKGAGGRKEVPRNLIGRRNTARGSESQQTPHLDNSRTTR